VTDRVIGSAGDAFEELVGRALAAIPEPFASRLESVAIVIDEDSPPGRLLGLYQGVPRTVLGADHAPVPSKITIFRRSLEWVNRDRAALEQAVEDTVFHEVAHHFGISDARLRELQREAKAR
jgi:predicted Zn-dependent protease with MMP-like domain